MMKHVRRLIGMAMLGVTLLAQAADAPAPRGPRRDRDRERT